MDPRVQQYLRKKEIEAKKKQEKRQASIQQWNAYKRDVLICAGLYDKVYSETMDEEYCHSEWDPQSESFLYFKQVPITVTEEEFEEIRKYSAISFSE